MEFTALVALLYLAVTLLAIGFQIALALGAPWGAYAMGGRYPGRFPVALRLLALVQALVLGLTALIVIASARLIGPGLTAEFPRLIWVVVAIAAASLVMNAASPSPGERRLWVPACLLMFACSLLVALSE